MEPIRTTMRFRKGPTREQIYNELTAKFFGITRLLADEEKKTELDGLLWDLSLQLIGER